MVCASVLETIIYGITKALILLGGGFFYLSFDYRIYVYSFFESIRNHSYIQKIQTQ
jgi:hypothetical protein